MDKITGDLIKTGEGYHLEFKKHSINPSSKKSVPLPIPQAVKY
jgi:hypothetical protein